MDENNHLFEMTSTDKSGTEEKMMEITYTRKSYIKEGGLAGEGKIFC